MADLGPEAGEVATVPCDLIWRATAEPPPPPPPDDPRRSRAMTAQQSEPLGYRGEGGAPGGGHGMKADQNSRPKAEDPPDPSGARTPDPIADPHPALPFPGPVLSEQSEVIAGMLLLHDSGGVRVGVGGGGGDGDGGGGGGGGRGEHNNDTAGAAAAARSAYSTMTTQEMRDALWNARFAELEAFRAERGHCRVPNNHPPNQPLSNWVQRQRAARRQGGMAKERADRLDGIGFEWKVRHDHEVSWERRYKELLAFRAKWGHCCVPQTYPPNQVLSNWVQHQRRAYRLLRAGRPSPMTEERRARLDEVGFVWRGRRAPVRTPPPPGAAPAEQAAVMTPQMERDARWNERFEELREFAKDCGHCRVPNDHPENQALSNWVQRQRASYRLMREGAKTNLTEERIERLEALGFEWVARHNQSAWDERLDEIRAFRDEHGHCCVPQTYPRNQALANWVQHQRGAYRLMNARRRSPMTEERLRRLEEVGFVWDARYYRVQVSPQRQTGSSCSSSDSGPGDATPLPTNVVGTVPPVVGPPLGGASPPPSGPGCLVMDLSAAPKTP